MKIKATGLINRSLNGDILDVFFPIIDFNGKKTDIHDLNSIGSEKETIELSWNQDDLDKAVSDTVSAYLKLHLLSYRFVLPNSINLDGLFSSLPNVAWTNQGPISINEIDEKLLESKAGANNLYIKSLDKFPCLTDYIIPKNVRIADASRVRLGAYLSSGTTVMHEGFSNFNAGTLGASMVEGRISAGVIVGDGSDIGGGASIMGTLSGGGKEMVTVGKKCLLGANSGLGISLGDECIIEAGLYITAGTQVKLPDGTVVKARELSGASGLLFRRNSQSGAVEAVQRTGNWGGLNAALHKN